MMADDGETPPRNRATKRRTARQPAAKPPGRPRLGGMRERLQDVNILLDVTRRISETDSLDEILEALVEMTSLALGCDRCSFFLNDPSTGELYSRVAQGIRRREIRLLNNDGVIGAAFQTGRSVILDDAYADPRFNPTIDRETGYVTKTVLCVPLRASKGNIIGVAQALNKAGGFFTDHDQALLEAIAAQSIPALRSSQTVERMQKARAQELAFLDIVADITSQIDLDQLLQRVMTEATRMLEGDRATLFLNDEKTGELFSRVAMGASVGEIRMPNHRHRRRRLHVGPDDQHPPRLCRPALQSVVRQEDRLFHALHSLRADFEQGRQGDRRHPGAEQEGGAVHRGGRSAAARVHGTAGDQPRKRQAVRRCPEYQELQREHAPEHVERRRHDERGGPDRDVQSRRPAHPARVRRRDPESSCRGLLRGPKRLGAGEDQGRGRDRAVRDSRWTRRWSPAENRCPST